MTGKEDRFRFIERQADARSVIVLVGKDKRLVSLFFPFLRGKVIFNNGDDVIIARYVCMDGGRIICTLIINFVQNLTENIMKYIYFRLTNLYDNYYFYTV